MIFENFLKSKNNVLILIVITLFFPPTNGFSQHQIGTIKGIVLDIHTHQPLEDVFIRLRNSSITKISDKKGKFTIRNVPSGEITLEFRKIGYQTLILSNIKITKEKSFFITVELSSWSIGVADVFYIGGIEITANKELLPEKLTTVTQITSSEIEHIQATSIGDVLDLVPGVEKKNQPSLKAAVKAKIRDPREENLLTSFAAKIFVDDVPFSNNVNMQGSSFKGVYTGMGNGVDLREIPADNIESVEVIRGIAPADYGDFLGAVINVKTKTFTRPIHRIKGKNNPDTKELNFGGSFPLKKTQINYNVNWAYSEQDIRKDYDGTQRLAAQLILKNGFLDNKLSVRNQFKYYALFENIKQHPIDPNAQKSTNKGFRFIYGNKTIYQLSGGGELSSNIYMNYRRLDSYQQYMVPADNRVISTLMENGTIAGIKKYDAFLFRQKTLGDEVSIGQRISWSRMFFTGSLFHKLVIGNELIYENNYGKGRCFDVQYPPSMGVRPRSFDDVPGAFHHSIYFNDQLSGRMGKEFSLSIGLRYERYDSGELNKIKFFKSKHGAFINPRINLAYYFSEKTQLRLGFGMASKSPALYQIYPNPFYLDVQDIIPINEYESVLDSIITTYKFDQSNSALKGMQEKKFELSLDHSVGKFALSVTGFYSERHGEPISRIQPFLYHKYSRPNWPHLDDSVVVSTLMDYYQKTVNGGWSKLDGLEITLRSQLIKKLNMDFSLNAAYYHVREKRTGLYGKTKNLINYTIPFYYHHGKWTQKLLFTYQVNYIAKALGIWVTLTAQHVPYFQYKILGGGDSLAVAYYDGLNDKIVFINEDDRLDEKYKIYRLNKTPFDYQTKKYKSKWLLNLSMSKSLFKGAEVSFFVNNFWDDRAVQEDPQHAGIFIKRNPEIFYGLEFSMVVDKFFH